MSAPAVLLRIIGVFGLLAALATMLIPGPATEVTGISTILALGGLALLAGHHWGGVVVAAADLILVGKLWPMVLLAPAAPSWSVIAALVLAVPGMLLFAATLPSTVEVLVGQASSRTMRLGAGALALGSGAYLAMPVLI